MKLCKLLGGISLAMAPDVAETTRIARPGATVSIARCTLNHYSRLPGTSHLSRRGWAMTGPMIWSSARCCEATNCRRGSLASTWSMFLLWKQRANRASLLKAKRFIVRARRVETPE